MTWNRIRERAGESVDGQNRTVPQAAIAMVVALKHGGSVETWGENLYGQTDVPVGAQSGWRQLRRHIDSELDRFRCSLTRTGGALSFTNPGVATNAPWRFYRVREQ